MGIRPGNIELNIRELVVHGLQEVDPAGIGPAVRRELARLAADPGPPVAGGADPAPGSATQAVGAEVARAVFRGMTK